MEGQSSSRSVCFDTTDLGHGVCVSYSQPAPYKVEASGDMNEDALIIHHVENSTAVIAVADGLGGHALGHEASALAVRCLYESVVAIKDESVTLREPILDALERCNQELLSSADGSATTIAVVEIRGRTIRPYHVGDSSIVVVGQRGRLKYQSISHSPIGLGVEAGLLKEDAASTLDERHWILNYLGSSEMRIEVGAPLELDRFDTLMVCSDAVTDNLTIPNVSDVIRKGPLREAMNKLVDDCEESMLKQSGHPDDLSVILYRPCA